MPSAIVVASPDTLTMKLRQLPEDFVVDEIGNYTLRKDGGFKIYLLEKKGLETLSLIGYLKKKHGISAIGIAGLKDKHAITRQFITIPSASAFTVLQEKNFSLTFLGYVDKAIGIGDLAGNTFTVVVRDIKSRELPEIMQRARDVEEQGVPNYFDAQRFGSVIRHEFMAKHIIKGDYEQAVKVFLTAYTRHEKSTVKKEKRAILGQWSNFSGLEIQDKRLSTVVNEYSRTNSWMKAYLKIPYALREMYVSAYQSYLWNECVKMLLQEKTKRLVRVPYPPGDLLFYSSSLDLPQTFPMISHDMNVTEEEGSVIARVLGKEGIALEQFNIKKETGNFFKTYQRQTVVKPGNFTMHEAQKDELNANKYKMQLSFSLPPGAYATLVTKRIFLQ